MDATPFETIQLENRGPIAILTLNRPDQLNAINDRMKAEIADALQRVEADDTIAVLVLRGAGRAFCAGFDLQGGDGETDVTRGAAEWRPILQSSFDAIMGFWNLSKPTIAAVHTYALAGGFEMALACDITIAAEGTRMGEPELKFNSGIVALLLPWLTNPKKAKQIILTGNDRLDARDALDIGLINEVVPAGEEFDAAMAMAREIAVVDKEVVRLTKKAINRSFETMGMGEALRSALEIDVEIESLETTDGKQFKKIMREQGLKAAVAWRDARFSSSS
jgi:enoyl-CoA hydratase